MKRQATLHKLLESLSINDAVIISGKALCKEAFKKDKAGYIYISTPGIASSVAMGVAMGTDKRVFVFVEDDEFLRSLEASPQLSVSGCKNLFYVILVSGIYQEVGFGCTIFEEIKAPRGFMFNLGFSVFDYTKYFQNKQLIASVPLLLERVRGPMALFVTIDKGFTNLEDIQYTEVELKDRFSKFIQNKELKSALFTQRPFISQLN